MTKGKTAMAPDSPVNEKLCDARRGALQDSIKQLQEQVSWANRFIILTLVGVLGQFILLLKEYVLP